MTEPLPEPGPELAERNREILAERAGWPASALQACRDLERRHPGWHCWWSERPWRKDGNVPDGAAFGAAQSSRGPADSLYAATPEELAVLIRRSEEQDRRDRPWLYRSQPQHW